MTDYNWEEILSKKTDRELYQLITQGKLGKNVSEKARMELEKRNFDFENMDSVKDKWKKESQIANDNSFINRYYNANYYLGSSLTILVIALFILTGFFLKDKPKSQNELKTISGVLSDYSFQEKKALKGYVKVYYLWLEDYKTPFQISANYIGQLSETNFKETEFKNEIKRGDNLLLKVYEKEFSNMNQLEDILVYSIDCNGKNYLSSDTTLKGENSNFELLIACMLIIGSFVFGIVYLKKRKTEKQKYNNV